MALTYQGVVAAGGVSNAGTLVLPVTEDANVGELVVIFVAHDQPGATPIIDLECTLLGQVESAAFALAAFYAVLEGSLATGFSELVISVSHADPNADIAVLVLHADGVTDGVTADYRTGADFGAAVDTATHSPAEGNFYLCGVARDGSAAELTPGSGWTDVGTEANAGGLVPRLDAEYRSAGSGTISGDGALGSSQNWAALMVFCTDNSGAGVDPAGADGNFLMFM